MVSIVLLFLCKQDYAKTTGSITTKLIGRIRFGSKKNPFNLVQITLSLSVKF